MSEQDTNTDVVVGENLTREEALGQKYPEHLRTRFTELDLTCPRCGSIWNPGVVVLVNAETHPAVREGILRRTMHTTRCPACKQHEYKEVDQIWEYYEPEKDLLIQVRPKWEYKAGGGADLYWSRLEDLVLKYAEDEVQVDVVFGFDGLIEKYLGGEDAVTASMRRRAKEIELKLDPGAIRADNEDEYFTPEELSSSTA